MPAVRVEVPNALDEVGASLLEQLRRGEVPRWLMVNQLGYSMADRQAYLADVQERLAAGDDTRYGCARFKTVPSERSFTGDDGYGGVAPESVADACRELDVKAHVEAHGEEFPETARHTAYRLRVFFDDDGTPDGLLLTCDFHYLAD